MKKLMVLLSLGFLSLNLAFADYKLMIKRGDGVQSEQCIKSYTFSNNLESLSRKKGIYSDVYSTKETMTNKIYKGKPVYRKIINYDGLIFDNTWHYVPFDSGMNVEEVVYRTHKWERKNLEPISAEWDTSGNYILDFYTINTGWGYAIGKNRAKNLKDQGYTGKIEVIIEYTKTTDLADDSLDSFKSYIHYLPSDSEDKKIITEEINNAGVQVLENHVYDKDLESCTKK